MFLFGILFNAKFSSLISTILIADIPNLPVPDVQNNLEKDDSDDTIPYEAIEPLTPYQQLPIHSRYYYERPGMC